MTAEKSFKGRVRERMAKTGESYSAARRVVAEKRERVQAARTRLAADKPASEAKLTDVTGKTWDEWFSILDRWGARDRKHKDTVGFLMDKQDIDGWWAQTITNGYERSRGMRLKHQQAEGFTIYASRTIAAPADAVFEAFVNARRRRRWLTDGTMRLRTSQPDRTARFDWEDGTTRVSISLDGKGPSKSTIAVAHERLPDADEAETAKAAWRRRLADLKAFLES